MNFVYFGSSEFSLAVLQRLCQNHSAPDLIVSQPDKPKGRNLKISPTAVSHFAINKNIPLLRPANLKDKQFGAKLKRKRRDFFFVADYGKILPAEIIKIPRQCALCLHPSLLPRWRGPAPISRAILNGETTSGVTVFKINERVDGGEIALQKALPIKPDDTIISLTEKYAQAGADLLAEAARMILSGECRFTAQIENRATYAPKFTKEEGAVNWSDTSRNIHNLIRATLGWPSAYTQINNLRIKIVDSAVNGRHSGKVEPGIILSIDDTGISVACGDGILIIKRVKPQGKREMSAHSFACGYRLKKGMRFDTALNK